MKAHSLCGDNSAPAPPPSSSNMRRKDDFWLINLSKLTTARRVSVMLRRAAVLKLGAERDRAVLDVSGKYSTSGKIADLKYAVTTRRQAAATYRSDAVNIIKRQNRGGIARLLAAGEPAVVELTMCVLGGQS